MDFDNLLSRADDEALQTLLGGGVVRLLELLEPGLGTPTKLREILKVLHTRESLLLSQESRTLLFELSWVWCFDGVRVPVSTRGRASLSCQMVSFGLVGCGW